MRSQSKHKFNWVNANVCRSLSRNIYGGRNGSAKSNVKMSNSLIYIIVNYGNERGEEICRIPRARIGERSDLIEIDSREDY